MMQLPLPTLEQALPGREIPVQVSEAHFVNGNPIKPPFKGDVEIADFALGCFWGAERKFWEIDNVYSTAVGYMGGFTPNATYEEVCSGLTGHTETVRVFYKPDLVDYKILLKTFWEAHNPTQGMRQGNDIGTQYRSAIFTHSSVQKKLADESMKIFTLQLKDHGFSDITTQIIEGNEFFYAEDYHQQYLAKNPNGYCGLGGTGVSCSLD
tara:strand:- start:1642 stop:2268 length:627 start_codon:yes stop_codon:yes gene_type:complete